MSTENTKVELTPDQKVELLFTRLKEKQAEVQKAERPSYITGGNFRYSEHNGQSFDIPTIRDQRKLVEILAFLIGKSKDYQEANSRLGIKDQSFTWFNFTIEEWETDLKTRVNTINVIELRKQLAVLEERINKIVSPEMRARMEADAIEKELGDM